MKAKMLLAVGLLQLSCLLILAQAPEPSAGNKSQQASTQQAPPANAENGQQDRGEKKFQQYVQPGATMRPPELPTQSTGTIMLHMRVRASLSANDAHDILHYLAP